MLSYQHTYHAGNHADLLKHIILGDVVTAMQQKETPMFLFDAFASRGIYDLHSPEALKNREFDTGIGKVWPLRHANAPTGITRWFKHIEAENSDGSFARFPGSTSLLASMLRAQDRLAACDLHPQEFEGLRNSFKSSRQLALHKRDAFEALGALLPPKEKRGMVFLDPSYEDKSEYKKIAQSIIHSHQHFRAGVYVIWYPLLPAERHKELFQELKRSGIRKILRLELDCGDNFPDMQMHGSGMLIINPPWHAKQAMQTSLHWINEKLTAGSGTAYFGWLVPE
ncbi:23S rRNA (adenine(2030)-N(6))-methyltransferase RlmJ [Mariprofundus sp. EBB-1]|uniref:23S rRNA (adenine(2030)-N(6))-methyltransferase RlmJ n=1 Tax=Mariprofundus sp. EBB-1 TaxID=2650971 RepID=UPI000EF2612D|nr:23S rRNA (adenine(2030)-N(6))-methyltransferase RlmJ [Mariprofundus sp. EBB-1]RLL55590.1 23S rRNA (adenine(2030)-N(6))-methyltransferase RlmJ [Mariprofundus sp. EBB-1]